jgi:Holliday junction DNA helicase RuvB
MAIDRVISPKQIDDAPGHTPDTDANWALRPRTLGEYVGQRELIERLSIAIEAAKSRGDALEHLLLHGPPGAGQDDARVCRRRGAGHQGLHDLGPGARARDGPGRGADALEHGDILFIDEIHRLPIAVEEFIYPAMEDFRIDVPLDTGLNARTVQIKCKPFTLIGATTRAGLLSSPLRSRFGLAHHLRYYELGDLESILHRSSGLLGIERPESSGLARSRPGRAGRPGSPTACSGGRGTTRRSARTGRSTTRWSRRRSNSRASTASGSTSSTARTCGPSARSSTGARSGLEAVAATMNEDAGTIEDVLEPYLLQIGFLARTRRGRMLTEAGAGHLGRGVRAGVESQRAVRTGCSGGEPADGDAPPPRSSG